jgi:hypothetical protein
VVTALGAQLQLVEVREPDEFEGAFSDIAQGHADAWIEFPSPMFFVERTLVLDRWIPRRSSRLVRQLYRVHSNCCNFSFIRFCPELKENGHAAERPGDLRLKFLGALMSRELA